MQRTGERADGSDEAGGDVGTGGCDHPGGEGGGVEAVVDGGDEVALNGCRPCVVRLLAGEHVEVVRREREVVARFDRLQSLAESVQGRQHGGDRGGHGKRVLAASAGVDVVHRAEPGRGTEQREGGAQTGERAGDHAGAGDRGQRLPHLGGQPTQAGGAGGEVGARRTAGQLTEEHEEPDVLETAALRQFDRRILPVVVEALASAHVSDSRVGDDHAGEPRGVSSGAVSVCVSGMAGLSSADELYIDSTVHD